MTISPYRYPVLIHSSALLLAVTFVLANGPRTHAAEIVKTQPVSYGHAGCAQARVGCDSNCAGCRAFRADCDVTPGLVTPSDEMPQVPSDIPPAEIQPSTPLMEPDEAFAVPPSALAPQPSGLASSFGGAGSAAGIPSMIGDYFGSSGYNLLSGPGTTVATAGGDRQHKWAENNSPFPKDRVFFNYHHFHHALTDVFGDPADLDRYTFGLEKTFFDEQSSVELRIPFATGLGSNPGGSDSFGSETEFGNISMALKHIIGRGPCSAVSVGLGIVFPTGDDFLLEVPGVPLTEFQNDSVRLQPFLGVYHAPTPRLFTQFFLQFDFDSNGNDVIIEDIEGVLQSSTLMMLDYSVGYWLHRNPQNRYFRGLAPMIELHYTTSVTDQDYGPFNSLGVTPGAYFVNDLRRDVLNLTGGLYFDLTQMSSLKIGAVAPLRDGTDKLFTAEIGVQFERRY